MLRSAAYGDTCHPNAGTHLNGDISDDQLWQKLWQRVVQLPTTTYAVPTGAVGCRFLATLSQEFQGVLDRNWNCERPLLLASVILQRTSKV